MGLGIILPRRVVEYSCACGEEFYDRSKGVRHAASCASTSKMDAEIGEDLERRKSLTTPLDEEAWRWGRKRAAEGKTGFRRGRAA